MSAIKLKIKDQAMAVQRKKKQIKRKFEKGKEIFTEEHLSKKISQKLSKSHRFRENMGVVLFSDDALSNLSHYSSYGFGFMWLLLIGAVMIFPTSTADLDPAALVINLLIVVAGLLIAEGIIFGFMKALGSKIKLKVYFFVLNTAFALSILIVSLPIAIVTFAIFQTMIKSESAVSMFFTLIPFYNYLIWGWSNETLAQLKGYKSVLFALLTLLLILGLNLLLPVISI